MNRPDLGSRLDASSDALVEAILEHGPVMLNYFDAAGRLLWVNPAWQRTLGYELGEAQQADFLERVYPAPEDRRRAETAIRSASGEWRDFVTHTRDGRRLETSWANLRLPGGGNLGLGVDRSAVVAAERERGQVKLRASESRFRAVFEHAALGIAIKDRAGRLVTTNPAFSRLLNRSPVELRSMRYADLTHPVDVDREREPLAEVLDGRRVAATLEKRFLRPGGQPIWARVTISRLPSSDHGPALVVVLAESIEHRRRLERERARLLGETRRLTQRLTMVEEAERRRLASELHDQVGASLAVLGLQLENLRQQLLPDASEEAIARLDQAAAGVTSISRDVRHIMAELRPPMLDEYGLLATLRWSSERLCAGSGTAVAVDGAEPDPRLPEIAEVTLMRVAQEAVNNALQHARARSIRLALEEPSTGLTRLSIADDGRGFEPNRTRWVDHDHWGIATMRERVEGLGGSFRIESKRGQGTRVVAEVRT